MVYGLGECFMLMRALKEFVPLGLKNRFGDFFGCRPITLARTAAYMDRSALESKSLVDVPDAAPSLEITRHDCASHN